VSRLDGSVPTVLSECRDGVTTITLNRPQRLNALIEPMLIDLTTAIATADAEPGARGIVITGAGTAFSAGQDLEAAAGFRPDDVDRVLECFNDVTRAILGTRIPVAAAVNGIAVGGGAEITLCCDVRLAAEHSEFFLPETENGMPIGNGTSYLLPRLVGSHAIWLVIGSRRIDAREALRIGLFDRVVPGEELLEAAAELMYEWGAPTRSTAQHLRMMRPPLDQVEAAMAREVEGARETLGASVMASGIRAYLDRNRPPTVEDQ
jgi:enoyl-CoA hydratase